MNPANSGNPKKASLLGKISSKRDRGGRGRGGRSDRGSMVSRAGIGGRSGRGGRGGGGGITISGGSNTIHNHYYF